MLNKSLFSSSKHDWETPQDLFDKLDKVYGFNLDPCATEDNAKCDKFFTEETDGLKQNWLIPSWSYIPDNTVPGRVFVNPPYGREIGKWVKKAHEEFISGNAVLIVMLLPARTDTAWFHDFIYGKADIKFLRGRLKFGDAKNSAPFPSMLVTYKEV